METDVARLSDREMERERESEMESWRQMLLPFDQQRLDHLFWDALIQTCVSVLPLCHMPLL